MKLPKVSAVLAAAVLAPAVLFPSSAAAADAPQPAGVSGPDTASDKPDQAGDQETRDRAEVQRILADKASGSAVREGAEKALQGGAAELRHFLDVELKGRQWSDDLLKVAQLRNGAGPVLSQAARDAINAGGDAIPKFLKEGQFAARAEDEDRAKVQAILADKDTGRGVREAGEKALQGDAAAVRHFLEVELPKQRAVDNQVKVAQILSAATGRGVKEAAIRALNGTNEDITKFLNEGWANARAEDDRVDVLRLMADKDCGPGVREAGSKALNGTAADVRRFLETGYAKARQDDDRVKLSQIMEAGGPAVKAAAGKALSGTYADVVTFLKEGQFTARAQDEADAARKPAQDRTPDAKPEAGQGQGVQPAAVTTTTGTTTATTTTATTTPVTTTGTAPVTSARPGQLAATGTDGLGWEAGGAAAAVAAGAALVAVSRRRRSAES